MFQSVNMIGGCCICLDERGWKENPLVYCDGTGCEVAVHQNCYGITKVPSGPWFCQKCADTSDSEEPPACCLCPRKTGALKKTTDKRWAHVVCAIYIPDITFGDTSSMEPVILDSLAESYFQQVCYLCEEKGNGEKGFGACISCHKMSCKLAFHVTCGQEKRLIGEEKDTTEHSQFCGYCDTHIKLSSFRQNSNSTSNTQTHNESNDSQDKFQTPLTVDVNNEAAKTNSRSKQRQRPTASGNPTKPKRPRKAPAKKNAGPRLVLHSPGLKSPLRSPLRSMRSPGLLSPTVRSAISLAPITSAQRLLEQQFDLGKKMLEKQAPLDIAQLLSCITKVQQENKLLEEELQSLTARRDTLVSLNARLALPTTMQTNLRTSNVLPVNLQTSLPSVTSTAASLPPASSVLSSAQKDSSQRSDSLSLTHTSQKSDTPSAQSQQGKKLTANVKEEKTSDVKSDSSVIKTSKKEPHHVKSSKSQSTGPPQRQTPDSQHFPWPPSQMFQLPSSRPTANAVGQMLPPINALGQPLPSVTSSFTPQSVNARGIPASSYNPYTSMSMFSLPAAMGDLNSMGLPSIDSMQQLAGLNSFMANHPMQRPPNE